MNGRIEAEELNTETSPSRPGNQRNQGIAHFEFKNSRLLPRHFCNDLERMIYNQEHQLYFSEKRTDISQIDFGHTKLKQKLNQVKERSQLNKRTELSKPLAELDVEEDLDLILQ